MLLAIDVGNTETVLGPFADDLSVPLAVTGPRDGNEPTGLAHHWRLVHGGGAYVRRTCAAPDPVARPRRSRHRGRGHRHRRDVLGPLVTANLRQMVACWFEVPSAVLEPGVKSGMPILYDNPKEVGADRIANAVGAHDRSAGPCVVVDLGTATTFDAISAAGEYLGGAITPGVAISLDALFANAAALGRVQLVEPRSVIGKSTVESIQSGALVRIRRSGRRPLPAVRRRTGRVHGGGHRRPVRAHLPVLRGDRVRGTGLTLHGLRLIFEPEHALARIAGRAGPRPERWSRPRSGRPQTGASRTSCGRRGGGWCSRRSVHQIVAERAHGRVRPTGWFAAAGLSHEVGTTPLRSRRGRFPGGRRCTPTDPAR